MAISAVVLTKNEEKNIVRCLESVSWCDEVVVIDDDSLDNTVQLAKQHAAMVYKHSLGNDFSMQRNFGLSVAKNEWVIFVDADEVISPALKEEIQKAITATNKKGYFLKREDFLWGKKLQHAEVGNMWLLRLGRKDAGRWQGKVHEMWKIHGSIQKLRSPLYHYPHQTIAEFLQELNYYTTLRAKELYTQKVHTSFFSIIAYTKAKFILNYVIKLGFLDGIEGFVFALLMSFHSFLVRGKLWLLWQKQTQSS